MGLNKGGKITSFSLSEFTTPEKRYQVEGEFFSGWEMINSFNTLKQAKELIIALKSKYPFEFRIMDNETRKTIDIC